MYKILFSKLKKYNIYKILFIILILIIIFILLKKQYVIERFYFFNNTNNPASYELFYDYKTVRTSINSYILKYKLSSNLYDAIKNYSWIAMKDDRGDMQIDWKPNISVPIDTTTSIIKNSDINTTTLHEVYFKEINIWNPKNFQILIFSEGLGYADSYSKEETVGVLNINNNQTILSINTQLEESLRDYDDEIKTLDYIKNELNSAIETIKDYKLFYREFILKYDVDTTTPNTFKKESPFSEIVKVSGDNAAIKKSLEKYSVLIQDPVTQKYEPTPNYDYKPIWNDINSIFNKSKKFIIHILKALTYITKYYTFPTSTFDINDKIYTDIKKYNFNNNIYFPIGVSSSGLSAGGNFLIYVRNLINYMKTDYNSNTPRLSPDTGSILQNIYKSFVILIYNQSLVVKNKPLTNLTFIRGSYDTANYKFTLFAQQKHIKDTPGIINSFNDSNNSNAYVNFKNLIVDLESYFGELIPFKVKLEEKTAESPELEININKLKNTIDNEYITVKNALATQKKEIKKAKEDAQDKIYYLKIQQQPDKYYKINDKKLDLTKETITTLNRDAYLENLELTNKITEANEIYENNKNKIKFSINEKSELEINLINPVIYNNEISKSKTNSIPGSIKKDHSTIMINIDTNDYSTVKDYLIHFYLDNTINDIFNTGINIIYELNEIITENEYNELQKQSKLKTTLGDDVEDLKEYNDLKNQYNNIMNNKEKRIKEHEEAQLYKRGQTILNKKISFNKKWIRTIKDITIGVHIFLYLVILVLVVYKLQ